MKDWGHKLIGWHFTTNNIFINLPFVLDEISCNRQSSADLFAGCGNGFEVVRYHSLAVLEESLPACLEATAWTCGQHHAVSLSRTQSEVGSSLLQGQIYSLYS